MKEFHILVVLVVITVVAPRAVSAGSCRTTELGHEYAGKVDKTKDGILCQRWDSQSPHKHGVDAANFPDATLSDAANYCRNPGSTPGGPWCYTTSQSTRWQSCDTPKCEGSCRITELGTEYAGKVDKTKDGISCQRWDSQSPHKFSVDAENLPDATLSDAANYCRNPSRTPGGPWCYTASQGTRWQFCDTPQCLGTWFQIQHVHSGLCLGIAGDIVHTWNCESTATNQQWKWDGKQIINRYGNGQYGMYLDLFDRRDKGGHFGQVKVGRPHNGADHKWTFIGGYLKNGCTRATCKVHDARLVPIVTQTVEYRQSNIGVPRKVIENSVDWKNGGVHWGKVGAGSPYLNYLYKWRLVPV